MNFLSSHLLLQVKAFPETVVKPNQISVEASIASIFNIKAYQNVVVSIVPKELITLDSVEMIFKDQYLSRSVMWRMKSHLVKSCVYWNKKIEFSGIRTQCFEMWRQGEKLACGSFFFVNHSFQLISMMSTGFIGPETKVVYRSQSSMVYLFLQMSSEMWDFDINGDLYFEKAVHGFLSDLFDKWQRFKCTHDVTIVLFSRTFYEASSIDEFPEEIRGCLQKDYKGRFYEDFYRVAVQNERYEDWKDVLILLKRLFNRYEKDVIKFHENEGHQMPRSSNSNSSQGNFLEVLNMSLNVFEKHHVDRSFDRTGQLSVVISPGVGVFEVDFELTNITKQRIIDNGIGSDLVCLGEQPLHAVPLFKVNPVFLVL